jgi:hypothetical protein
MEEQNQAQGEPQFAIPEKYRPISAWGYFGYNLLFLIPIAGFILLIVFSFDNSNINRRNYARSYFCGLLLAIIIIVVFIALGAGAFYSLKSTLYGLM